MPLCTACRAEARIAGRDASLNRRRPDTCPPHGMAWGDECDCCDNAAEVAM